MKQMKFSKKKFLTTLLALLFPVIGMAAANEEVHIPQNRVLYEIFVRNFSQSGKFTGVTPEIPRIRELGVDIIWLMPIYKLGDIGKWGTYSSPYAVKNYKMVNPDLGTEAELKALIQAIHDNGMEVWFDWVGNHTSKDNVWVTEHPEYYKKDSNGNIVSPNGWSDVYQLDVNNVAMHEAMIEAMQYWVDNFDIDGYRCDFASGPSEEFWKKATSRVLKNGNRVVWLAEDDSKPQLVTQCGFDYNWVWGYQQSVKSFTDNANSSNLNSLKNFCKNLHSNSDYRGKSRLMYLETHDIVQDQQGTAAKLYGSYLKPMTVLTYTVYGMPMLYNGQEIGYNHGAVSLAEKTPVDWSNPNNEIKELVTKLAWLKHSQPALRDGNQNGSYTELSADDNLVYAFKRTLQNSNVVVLLNLNNSQKTFSISSGLPEGNFEDVFSDNKKTFNGSASFTLPAYGYAVYVSSDDDGFVEPEQPDPSDNVTNLTGETVFGHGEKEGNYIYVENLTGWDSVYIYGYANDKDGAFGAWPGTEATGSYAIGSHVYKRIEIPNNHVGAKNNLIANSGNGTQYDLNEVTLSGNIYYTLNATSGTQVGRDYCVYIADNTGWENLAIYGWQADGISIDESTLYIQNNTGWDDLYVYAWGTDEMFGKWPGTKGEETAVIDGVTYFKYKMDYKSGTYNLIFNNGKGENDGKIQYNALSISSGESRLIKANATSCETLTMPSSAPAEIFGGWPGVKAMNETEVKFDGHQWHHFTVPASCGGATYNMIVNNWMNNTEDGAIQYDWTGLTIDRDYFFTLGHSTQSDGVAINPNTYTIYIHDNAQWGDCYVYVKENNGTTKAVGDEHFGAVNGTKAEEYVNHVSGYNIYVVEVPESAKNKSVDIVLSDGGSNLLSGNLTLNTDLHLKTDGTTTVISTVGSEMEETAPVYFNMQGMRVDRPEHGVYIVVRNGKASKILL